MADVFLMIATENKIKVYIEIECFLTEKCLTFRHVKGLKIPVLFKYFLISGLVEKMAKCIGKCFITGTFRGLKTQDLICLDSKFETLRSCGMSLNRDAIQRHFKLSGCRL